MNLKKTTIDKFTFSFAVRWFVLLFGFLMAVPAISQQDYKLSVYRNGEVTSEHRCEEVDSMTVADENQLLVWKSGSCTSFLLAEVDSVLISKAERLPKEPPFCAKQCCLIKK